MYSEEIYLTEQEKQIINSKMAKLGMHNFESYARKMLIDGYIINVTFLLDSPGFLPRAEKVTCVSETDRIRLLLIML